jgi:26S proteasome regulatory subunit (ATPase 3-interacting protein)
LTALDAEHKAIEEENKILAAEVKAAAAGMHLPAGQAIRLIHAAELAKLKSIPTDTELQTHLDETTAVVGSTP